MLSNLSLITPYVYDRWWKHSIGVTKKEWVMPEFKDAVIKHYANRAAREWRLIKGCMPLIIWRMVGKRRSGQYYIRKDERRDFVSVVCTVLAYRRWEVWRARKLAEEQAYP